MLDDLKHACRMFLHARGWTAVVLLSLALGIGANTALFTAVNGLLLRTVPVPEPESLVRLKWAGKNDMARSTNEYGFTQPYRGLSVTSTVPYPTYKVLRAANRTLTDIAAFSQMGGLNVVVNGAADIATAFQVSGNYFDVMRVPMALGRGLVESDDAPSAAPAAVISHAYWRQRFGSDPKVMGGTYRMNNTPVTIVGVTAASYNGIIRLDDKPPDITIPIAHGPTLNPGDSKRMTDGTSYWLLMAGRLKPGVTFDQVTGNLGGPFEASIRQGSDEYAAALTPAERELSRNKKERTQVPSLFTSSASHGMYDVDNDTTRSAAILSVVVTLILLIVCANVANLLLSRATARNKEISVRLSMGASRWRLVRQLLTESLLLSGAGGALGVLVGYWSKSLLPFGQNAAIDARVLAFAVFVSVLAGVAFGLLPALRATRVDLAGAMKEGGRSVTSTRSWLSKGLLVLQVAISLVLLVGAGLFLRTLSNLRSVDVGFNPNNLMMFRVNPGLNRYEPERVAQLLQAMRAEIGSVPGVRSVAYTRVPLLAGSRSTTSFHIQGRPGENSIHIMNTSPEFFATLEIPVVMGRGLLEEDVKTPGTVAVLNEAAVKKFFPDMNPIGARFGSSPEEAGKTEIVGIIRDTKYTSLREPAPPTMYQVMPARAGLVTVVVRTASDPANFMEAVRKAMRKVDPDVPITGMTTQTEQVEGRMAQERLFALAYALFGGLALLLACIGLFGLMSYSVSRRTNEIGVRIALGAQREGIVALVMRESMTLVAAGVVLGLAATLALGRLVASVLFGLAPTDAWTIGGAVLMMGVVAMGAAYLPARRASRVDPMAALRYE
ncbi:MAG: ABC transporter permease [Vicinamibacteria bacterium]|nr:ABC transporter permease [Vicinamibacteria bacterium]